MNFARLRRLLIAITTTSQVVTIPSHTLRSTPMPSLSRPNSSWARKDSSTTARELSSSTRSTRRREKRSGTVGYGPGTGSPSSSVPHSGQRTQSPSTATVQSGQRLMSRTPAARPRRRGARRR